MRSVGERGGVMGWDEGTGCVCVCYSLSNLRKFVECDEDRGPGKMYDEVDWRREEISM